MADEHGSVVLVDDPYKGGSRPFLAVSNDTRPYYGENYILVVTTTTEFSKAVRLDADDVVEGQLNIHSYISIRCYYMSLSTEKFTTESLTSQMRFLVASLTQRTIKRLFSSLPALTTD